MNLDKLINQINNWDCQDAKDLLNLIKNCEEKIEQEKCGKLCDHIDMSYLPYSKKYESFIKDDVDGLCGSYPIWTIDASGNCLVGESADEIEHIDSILEC